MLPSIHRQAVFEKIARHLFAQGKKSVTLTDSCAYRGADGLMCAAGVLLPDNEITDTINTGIGWRALVENITSYSDYSPTAKMLDLYVGMTDMVDRLQKLHDADGWWENEKAMWFALSAVAEAYNCNADFLSSLSFPQDKE